MDVLLFKKNSDDDEILSERTPMFTGLEINDSHSLRKFKSVAYLKLAAKYINELCGPMHKPDNPQ